MFTQLFIVRFTGIASIYPSKSDLVKAAVANISCLFIEAARHDYDKENLKMFLHNEHINGQRIEKLCSTYMNNKQEIQMQLELTGDSIAHVVDVDWNLHHCVKVSSLITLPSVLLYIAQFQQCTSFAQVTLNKMYLCVCS